MACRQPGRARRRPGRPLTHTPCTPSASVVSRAAPPGRSSTRRFGPRPTVAGSNSSRSAAMACAQQAAIRHAEHARRVRGQLAHRLGHRHRAALARPVAEQVQPEAGVVEEGQVRARVAEADDAVRVVQHAADRLLVAVEQLRGEDRAQVLGERQVEHHVERVRRLARRRSRRCSAARARACARPRDLDHLDLVPLAVEEAEGRRRRELGAHAVAEGAVGQSALERRAVQRRAPAASSAGPRPGTARRA